MRSLVQTSEIRTLQNVRNRQHHTTSQRILFLSFYKTCVLLKIWQNLFEIDMDFIFLSYFPPSNKILCPTSVFLLILKMLFQ